MSRYTKSLSQGVAFAADSNGYIMVYVNNVPDIQLTQLYRRIESEQDDAVARYAIRLLHSATYHLADPWTAAAEAWQQGIEALLAQHYGADVEARTTGHTRIRCGEGVSAKTVSTVLARLTTACNAAIDLGLRDDTPLSRVRMRRPYARPSPVSKQATGRYVVYAGRSAELQNLIDNHALPDQLREAADKLKLCVRDRAILEILISTGARVHEVVEMRWAGYDPSKAEIWLTSKGSNGQLAKTAKLSDAAKKLLDQYIMGERLSKDPLYRSYMGHHSGRLWSYDGYTNYLRASDRDLVSVPIFLNQRGAPYRVAALRIGVWQRLAKHVQIRPHQIRYWYINRKLDQMLDQYSDNEYQMLIALQRFVSNMGWQSWEPLKTYDLRGIATTLLARYDRKLEQMGAAVINHGGTHITDMPTALARTISSGVIPDAGR